MGLIMSGDHNAIIGKILKLPIKQFFMNGIRYRNLQKAVFAFAFVLGLQLKYSRRSRSMALRLCHSLVFGCTFFGLIITVIILLVKYNMHNRSSAAAASQRQAAIGS